MLKCTGLVLSVGSYPVPRLQVNCFVVRMTHVATYIHEVADEGSAPPEGLSDLSGKFLEGHLVNPVRSMDAVNPHTVTVFSDQFFTDMGLASAPLN